MAADVEESFKLVSRAGFDAIEIAVRDPQTVSAEAISNLARGCGIEIAAIGTGQAYVEEGLSLTSTDPGNRGKAIQRIKAQIDLGANLGARVIIGLIRGSAEKDKIPAALDSLKAALIELGEYARDSGAPGLLLEPINRYETRLINSVEQGVEFLEGMEGLPVNILADTFHMNIEDRDLGASIRLAGPQLGHVHFADSNRWAPGQGHLDFGPVVKALADLGYSGYLSAEILPEPSPEQAVMLTAEFFKKILQDR